MELNPSTSIIHQEIAFQTWLQVNLMETFSQLNTSSQMTLGLCQVDKQQ